MKKEEKSLRTGEHVVVEWGRILCVRRWRGSGLSLRAMPKDFVTG